MKNDEHGHFHRSFLCDKPHAVNVVAGQITRGLPLTLSRLNFFLHTFRGGFTSELFPSSTFAEK